MLRKNFFRSFEEVLANIIVHEANHAPDTECNAEDLMPTSQLKRDILFLVEETTDISDMVNVLTN